MIAAASLLLSLVAPGAGHIFCGFYTEGIVLGVLFALGKSVLLPLCLRVFRVTALKRTLQLFYVCNCCYMALILYAAISAFVRGLGAENVHFLYAILFAAAITLTYKNTLNAFIFTALCGRTEVYGMLRGKGKIPTEKK